MALEVVVGPQDRRVVSHPPDEHHAHRKTLRHHAGNIDGRMPRRVEPAGVGDHFPSSHDLLLERRVRAWNLRRLDRRRRHHENIELFAGPQGAVTLRDLLDQKYRLCQTSLEQTGTITPNSVRFRFSLTGRNVAYA